MGRITAVSATPSGGTSTPVVSSIANEPFGPNSGITYGNAVAETRGFDQDYRLTGVTDTGTSALQNLGYAYYPTNNVQTITDTVNSANSQSFSYDTLQHLSAAAGGYGSFGYTYDLDGNRVSQTHGIETTNYGYGSGSDLLATLSAGGVQTQAIGYTADGRIASLSPGIQAPGGQTITSLSYNQDARLAAVNASGDALASYTYDGFGQRLIKTVSSSYGEIYQYGQNGMVLEATNASGAAQADYIYLDGRPVATLNPSTGALYFLHDDMLGTPQLATDSSQSVAWQASYEPFGQASVSGTVTQNLRFPGQYFDVESGWNHNGFRNYLPDLGRYMEPDPLATEGSARYYNPNTGRFLSEDPSGLARSGSNLYGYAGDNPIDFSDPLGLYSGPYGPPITPNPPLFCFFSSCFPYYGNYGGPHWTGGQWEPWENFGDPWSSNPNPPPGLALPVDAQDGCYADHDRCYARARHPKNGKCSSNQESDDDKSCDGALMQCLAAVNSSGGSSNNRFSHLAQPLFSAKELWW
jgi:RHS repeat-associated protein